MAGHRSCAPDAAGRLVALHAPALAGFDDARTPLLAPSRDSKGTSVSTSIDNLNHEPPCTDFDFHIRPIAKPGVFQPAPAQAVPRAHSVSGQPSPVQPILNRRDFLRALRTGVRPAGSYTRLLLPVPPRARREDGLGCSISQSTVRTRAGSERRRCRGRVQRSGDAGPAPTR